MGFVRLPPHSHNMSSQTDHGRCSGRLLSLPASLLPAADHSIFSSSLLLACPPPPPPPPSPADAQVTKNSQIPADKPASASSLLTVAHAG